MHMTKHELVEEAVAALHDIGRGMLELGKDGAVGPGAVESVGMAIAEAATSIADSIQAVSSSLDDIAEALEHIAKKIS